MSKKNRSKDRKIENKWNCVFCDVEMNSNHDTHNPEPVKESTSGRCCSHCNTTVVIPARLSQLFSDPKQFMARVS